MVEISMSGSGEGPGRATGRGYSTGQPIAFWSMPNPENDCARDRRLQEILLNSMEPPVPQCGPRARAAEGARSARMRSGRRAARIGGGAI